MYREVYTGAETCTHYMAANNKAELAHPPVRTTSCSSPATLANNMAIMTAGQVMGLYTGEGQRGDMDFVRGNLAIRDHVANGKDLHLFEYVQTGYVRYRSNSIRVYVLKRANGTCEGCGAGAPFKTTAGRPYLEPHHIRRLSDGGPDDPNWVIALCPNCHRRAHYGQDRAEYNQGLTRIVETIEESLMSS